MNALLELQLQKIQLRQFTFELYMPNATAVEKQFSSGFQSIPYWSRLWPAALALSDFLIAEPGLVFRKNVMELGAGLGLPSMVAASGARYVLASDADPLAVEAMELSVRHNRFQNMQVQIINWESLPPGLDPDVLLLSDINYNPMNFPAVHNMIHRFLQNGTTIILSTPQRLMAKPFIASLMPFCTSHQNIPVPQEGQQVMNTIMVLAAQA